MHAKENASNWDANKQRIQEPATLIVFGATGDLASRKLFPALFLAYSWNLLPESFRVVGFARRELTDFSFRDRVKESINTFCRLPPDPTLLEQFLAHLDYQQGDLSDPTSFQALEERIENNKSYPPNRLFYLSVIPSLFEGAIRHLKESHLVRPINAPAWTRVVVEKPFGKDLASARALNNTLLHYLDESQIFRIDHYLGKETVQNILSFRFANSIFEPIFNGRQVDHIQITAAERVGLESGRGGYYDEYGAVRDMLTNHLLQLLCLVTMEPPSDLSADAIRNEKLKILHATQLDLSHGVETAICTGQYTAGTDEEGRPIKGYLEEDRIAPDSKTETFAAIRLAIQNWRWAGVPIFLRTGKQLTRKTTEIAIQFKLPPLQLFEQVECENNVCDITRLQPNTLIFRIQPDEGIMLKVGTKRPGMRFVVEDVEMDFSYSEAWKTPLPDAYERLLLDVLRGDSTLFTRSDEVEAEWRVVQPILDQLEQLQPLPYSPGSWGPAQADTLFLQTNGSWRNPSEKPEK